MATSVVHEDGQHQLLIWLDDGAGNDKTITNILNKIFGDLKLFHDSAECLTYVQSLSTSNVCLSMLVSGKYGEMLVKQYLQQLDFIKAIYVFCFDMKKHSIWAQHCDKVRCVSSEILRIIKEMEREQKMTVEVLEGPEGDMDDSKDEDNDDQAHGMDESKHNEKQRFIHDNTFYNQLALDLLLTYQKDDGFNDFRTYCEQNVNPFDGKSKDLLRSSRKVDDWYQLSPFLYSINVNNIQQLWTLRWFLRAFHQQIFQEHEALIDEPTESSVFYAAWLSDDELDRMKLRMSQTLILTDCVHAYEHVQDALNTVEEKPLVEQTQQKVLFEIMIDPKIKATVPFTAIRNHQYLFWFASRHRLMKIEYVQQTDGHQPMFYWKIGLNLMKTCDFNPAVNDLYQFYRKMLVDKDDLYYAFGRILMLNGKYDQSEKWLENYEDYNLLAELAIRQGRLKAASAYLTKAPEDSNETHILRAYVYILSSNDMVSKGRSVLMKICAEDIDKLIRVRAYIALGFINLALSQNAEQAMDYFQLAFEMASKFLPEVHPDIAKILIGIGYTYYACHNTAKVKESFGLALAKQQQVLACDHPDLAKTRCGLARCQSTNEKQSLSELNIAYTILMRTFHRQRKTHPEILATLNDIKSLRKGKKLQLHATLLSYI
jgi:tetratricopeptide (TPR) repeat protein